MIWKSSQECLNNGFGVSASITGTQINTGFGGGTTWTPTHTNVHAGSKTVGYCKGASLLTGGTSGLLAVHLVDDLAGVYYLIDLVAGAGIFKCNFDLIGNSTHGTTVTLDGKLFVYPALYLGDNSL